MKISNHFALSEFLRSETAARHDIPMDPPPAVLANLERLAVSVLDPIRVRAGCPIIVTSGYRPPELNRMIGGAKNSDHMKGLAADIHAVGMPLVELLKVVRSLRDRIPLDRCIEEFGQWLHVAASMEMEEPSGLFLTARREEGKTVYRESA